MATGSMDCHNTGERRAARDIATGECIMSMYCRDCGAVIEEDDSKFTLCGLCIAKARNRSPFNPHVCTFHKHWANSGQRRHVFIQVWDNLPLAVKHSVERLARSRLPRDGRVILVGYWRENGVPVGDPTEADLVYTAAIPAESTDPQRSDISPCGDTRWPIPQTTCHNTTPDHR